MTLKANVLKSNMGVTMLPLEKDSLPTTAPTWCLRLLDHTWTLQLETSVTTPVTPAESHSGTNAARLCTPPPTTANLLLTYVSLVTKGWGRASSLCGSLAAFTPPFSTAADSCGLWVLHEACHCTQRCQFRSTIRACWTAYVVFVDVCSAADVPAKHYTTQGSANSVCDNSHFCSHMQNIHYGFLPCNASDRLICKPLALSACRTNK